MEDKELLDRVKENLIIEDESKDLLILDVIQEVKNYCNLKKLPSDLEPFIRKKVKAIIIYESEHGDSVVFDIKSIKEGDTSISYNVDEKNSKDTIYGLSDKDKSLLRSYRRTRK
ncbi:DNA-packaging protein [Clostridium sp.]|uniref:DNA-packaging protein n=1 Tax=Clostridium sp. TaxID=1506 RepID=UPI0029068566|nr:DNA-packaging protein [Clostridium sp.]MDU4726390.1 DNA-packaging protein [Clostridium sp.]